MAFWGATNLTCTDATIVGDIIWATKTALKLAGWTVRGSSDGTTWQNGGSTDHITSQAVANNAGAWIRLREPSGAGGREYVFFRGSAGTRSIIAKYSRSVGFGTGGAAQALPTTGASGDGVVWLANVGGFSATATGTNTYDMATTTFGQQVPYGAISTGYINCVASDTPVNGVYGFWGFINTQGTGAVQIIWYSEGMDASTCSPLDNDPSIRQNGNLLTLRSYNNNAGNSAQYWVGYPAVWSSPTTAAYSVAGCGMTTYNGYTSIGLINTWIWPLAPGNLVQALSPYNGKSGLFPVLVAQGGAAVAGALPKGFTSGVRIVYGVFNSCDTLDLTTTSPSIILGSTTYSGTVPSWIVFPWVQNVLPLF